MVYSVEYHFKKHDYVYETEYEEVTDPLTGVTVKVPKKK